MYVPHGKSMEAKPLPCAGTVLSGGAVESIAWEGPERHKTGPERKKTLRRLARGRQAI